MYTVYTKENCIWCNKAKHLLTTKGVQYKELKYGTDYERDDLMRVLGRDYGLSLPQIFDENGELIGGYQELEMVLGD